MSCVQIMLDNRNIAEHVDERMYQALLKPVEESQCYDANLLTPILRSIKASGSFHCLGRLRLTAPL